jgi:peptidylprolyl isomerase
MELLSALPRGKGALGFYTDAKQYVPIKTIRVGSDLPPDQRLNLEVLRTDTRTWRHYVEARRSRKEAFFVEPTGHIDVCNMPLPVREVRQP